MWNNFSLSFHSRSFLLALIKNASKVEILDIPPLFFCFFKKKFKFQGNKKKEAFFIGRFFFCPVFNVKCLEAKARIGMGKWQKPYDRKRKVEGEINQTFAIWGNNYAIIISLVLFQHSLLRKYWTKIVWIWCKILSIFMISGEIPIVVTLPYSFWSFTQKIPLRWYAVLCYCGFSPF